MKVFARPSSVGRLMNLLHGGASHHRWWHRLPGLGPKAYTHSFKLPDEDEAIKLGESYLAAYREARETESRFREGLRSISLNVNTTSADMDKLADQVRKVAEEQTRWQRWRIRAEFVGIEIGDWLIERVPGMRRLAKTLEKLEWRWIAVGFILLSLLPLAMVRFPIGLLGMVGLIAIPLLSICVTRANHSRSARPWSTFSSDRKTGHVMVEIKGKPFPTVNKHKRALQREQFHRGMERVTWMARMSGHQIGWLRGVKWDWPWWSPGYRPYDWAIDGLPPAGTKPTYIWGQPIKPPPTRRCQAKLPDGKQCRSVARGGGLVRAGARCDAHLAGSPVQ